jgi:glycosyltransferase involved in cell wall biosynthesis
MAFKFSIIVPVYNAERYLSACLDSLLDQGLTKDEYEVLLVNDGSTDHSKEICQSYSTCYSNISVFNQENQGVAMARNYGLSKARGEWVMFVDSDDYLCKDSLRYLLLNFCKNEYDGIRFWTRIRSDATIDKNYSCQGKQYYTDIGYNYIKVFGLETFCISFLYRRSFLESQGIQFLPFKMGEDFFFASKFLLSNPRICSTSCIVYQYLIHPNSASTSRNKVHARECAYHHLEVNDRLLSIINQKEFKRKDSIIYEKCLKSIQSKMSLIFSRILSSDITLKEFKQIVESQKKIGILPMETKGGSIKSRLSFRFINLLSVFPLLYVPTRVLYSHFFVPLILPKLNRNR